MSTTKDHRIVEAIIFGSNEPVNESDLKEKISNDSNITNLLNDLKKLYEERGINLIKTGDRWSFRTSTDLSQDLIILKKQKRKLSRAAIEVLSIIAYHQPITRAEIENIRGVQTGRGSIDILIEVGWIKPKGRRNTPGRPVTWATTDNFLDHFSLEKISDLPGLEELKASGFMEKRSAISTITDLVKDNFEEIVDHTDDENNNLDDFISSNN
ncbi:MAG: SMC-Scp complex subunit ScpB [Pelagibacteraceae bacterium]|nr:SMC-Scp complex subunit ScpB [Pelagibacteraceae bacterium]|tara:strand:- start:21667 stop:22302 length:636 start_codon:yes stop_codon:yes gene_type:complete